MSCCKEPCLAVPWIIVPPIRLTLPRQDVPGSCALESRCVPHYISLEAEGGIA